MSARQVAASTGTSRARVTAGSLYVAAIVVTAAMAAWPIYRSGWFLLLVAVSTAVAALIAGTARIRGWGGALTTAVVGGAFLLLAVPLGVPSRLGGPLDLLRGLADALAGALFAWKDLVTVDLPVGTYRNLLVPALILFLGGTCSALLLSWRKDSGAYAAAPIASAMVVFGLIFGRTLTSEPVALGPAYLYAPVETAIGAAGLVVTLLWLSWRSRAERVRALERAATSSGVRVLRRPSSADRRRAALGAGLLAVAIVGVMVVVPFAARGADRSVLRAATGPEIDLAAEASPLSSYRALFDDGRAEDVLFTVDAQQGAPARLRVATLDSYDGEVFRAGGGDSVAQAQFVRVPATLDAGVGDAVRAEVAIDDFQGIWMPTAGRLASVDFLGARAPNLVDGFYYSASAQAGLQTAGGGLAEGDVYVISAVEPAMPDLADLEAPGVPSSSIAAPERLAAWVERHQDGSGGAALDGLVRLLRDRGYLSHALSAGDEPPQWTRSLAGYSFQPSASGHSLARIDAMFERLLERESDPRAEASGNYVAAVGDDEQFSVAVALIAQELGFPARVVVGARLSSADPTLPTCDGGSCRAQDLAAWTEVQAASGEWVPIDVTPQYEDSPSLEVTEQRDPENVTDVLPDTLQEVLPPEPIQQDSAPDDAQDRGARADLAWLWSALRTTGIVALVLALAFGPFLAVVAAKASRRRGRRSAPLPADRIAGGWDEYVDAAADAGREAPPALTRGELAEVYATAGGPRLAAAADRAVFSSDRATADEAAEFWAIVDRERRGLRTEGGFWHGLRATVSLRSFVRNLTPPPGRRDRTAERGLRGSAPSARTSP